jgi:hypothetical protein
MAKCGMAKAIIMCLHIHTTGTGERLHNKGVYYQLKVACRRERVPCGRGWWCFKHRHRWLHDAVGLPGCQASTVNHLR